MNVVDSCGWLEFLADGRNADFFGPPILKVRELLVPTVSLYEIFKRVMQQRGQSLALQAVALMQQGQVVELEATLALAAAKLSLDEGLAMANKPDAGHGADLRRCALDPRRGFCTHGRRALREGALARRAAPRAVLRRFV